MLAGTMPTGGQWAGRFRNIAAKRSSCVSTARNASIPATAFSAGRRFSRPMCRGAWINPDAVSAEELVTTALACPSGAITYERIDGGPQEAPPAVNFLRIRENVPFSILSDIRIGETVTHLRATL